MRYGVPAVAALILLVSFSAIEANDCDKDLGEWFHCNNPRVISYLQRLSPKDIDKVMEGVTLTDGTKELHGYKYLGKANGFGNGINLSVFEENKRRVAYVWIDSGGDEIPVPSCQDWPEEDSYESAYVLSGDVYTWKVVKPGEGVIKIMCINNKWLH